MESFIFLNENEIKMSLLEILSKPTGRIHTDMAVRFINNDPERFAQLVNFVTNGETSISHRASWALSIIAESSPHLFEPYIGVLIGSFPHHKHTGVTRMVLRSLSLVEIPENELGRLFDICLKIMEKSDLPVGLKANAIEVLTQIGKKIPELNQELKLVFDFYKNESSLAIRSKIKKFG